MGYNKIKAPKTNIRLNQSVQGESIEEKVQRITVNREPIKDGAPIIYTERKEGVRPEFDIRTDRFEIAVDATDKASKLRIAAREERHKTPEEKEAAKKAADAKKTGTNDQGNESGA